MPSLLESYNLNLILLRRRVYIYINVFKHLITYNENIIKIYLANLKDL